MWEAWQIILMIGTSAALGGLLGRLWASDTHSAVDHRSAETPAQDVEAAGRDPLEDIDGPWVYIDIEPLFRSSQTNPQAYPEDGRAEAGRAR